MKSFIREKKIYCGADFLAVGIFQYSEMQGKCSKGKRAKKQKESAPKQKNLNDKRAKRYFIQLGNTNFGAGDLAVHLTYADEYLPDTPEEAHKIVFNYLRKVDYLRKKKGLPALKYLLVTQIGRKKDGTHRIHHHILMNGGLSRDTVENLWWIYKGTKKEKYLDRILYGWANADRLRPNKKGIAQICGYMIGTSLGKKHWTQSQNLERPWSRPNDSKYSKRAIERICKIPQDAENYKKYWESKYPGYEYIESERQYNDLSSWSIYLTLTRMKC